MNKGLIFFLFDKLRHRAVQRPVQGPDEEAGGKSPLSSVFCSLYLIPHRDDWAERGPGLTVRAGSHSCRGQGGGERRSCWTGSRSGSKGKPGVFQQSAPFIASPNPLPAFPNRNLGPITALTLGRPAVTGQRTVVDHVSDHWQPQREREQIPESAAS